MIRIVRLENFKCLLDVEVRLEPFTVLIGPNDSGKSSFLDAIQLLGRTTQSHFSELFRDGPQKPYSLLESLVWRKDTSRSLVWQVKENPERAGFEYQLEIPSNLKYGKGAQKPLCLEWLRIDGQPIFDTEEYSDGRAGIKVKDLTLGIPSDGTVLQSIAGPLLPGLKDVIRGLSSTEKYCLDASALREPCAPAPEPQLTRTGSNLAAVLESIITGKHRSEFAALESTLHEAIPTLGGITLPTVQQPTLAKALEFTLSPRSNGVVSIPAKLASDGALLMTAFLALAYGNTPEILLIEEPENGLHPSRLKLVIDILHRISRGEVGNRPRQVILTTHSPLLLNFVTPDQVRIFQRTENGATRVTPMNAVPKINELLKEFAPGELWYLFGEEDLVKGPKP